MFVQRIEAVAIPPRIFVKAENRVDTLDYLISSASRSVSHHMLVRKPQWSGSVSLTSDYLAFTQLLLVGNHDF